MKTVDDIYVAISKNITDVIKENWSIAVLHLEVLDGMVSTSGEYHNSLLEKKQLDTEEFDFQLTFEILELHQVTTDGGNNRWNRAIFNLTSAGNFDMEFIWDQELNDDIESHQE